MQLIIALVAGTFGTFIHAQSFGCELAYNLRKQFLDFHNQKREDVAKGRVFGFNPAKNMYKLTDNYMRSFELLSDSLHGIRGEKFKEISDNFSLLRFYGGRFGQPQQFIQQTLDTWWKNVQKYRLGPDNRYPSHGLLYHAANIINADTTQIGCTYNVCGSTLEVLCLYDDGALLKEKILYETGSPCKNSQHCTTYRKSTCDTRTGLCVRPKEPRDNGQSFMCSRYNGLTDKIRRTILDLHNDFRSLVARGKARDKLINNGAGFAPKAANMRKLEYDCDLERTASNYARGCQFKHSPLEYRNAGESLYTVFIDNLDKNKIGEWATRWWFAELKEFGVGSSIVLTRDMWDRRGKKIGHYTQMVWAETDRIGCGIQHCPRVQTLVVCHYRKGGNIFDQMIYEIGEPCTRCPYGYKCTKDKLCARS